MSMFNLGQVVITKQLNNAIEQCEKTKYEVYQAFNKYCVCDWGDTCDSDKQLNHIAVKDGEERIVAKYHINSLEKDIFIITEWDRSATTLLFCDEY